jgi:alpha-L-fucosidase
MNALPKPYNPIGQAAVAKEGGMRYMMLMERHHDGLALFKKQWMVQ